MLRYSYLLKLYWIHYTILLLQMPRNKMILLWMLRHLKYAYNFNMFYSSFSHKMRRFYLRPNYVLACTLLFTTASRVLAGGQEFRRLKIKIRLTLNCCTTMYIKNRAHRKWLTWRLRHVSALLFFFRFLLMPDCFYLCLFDELCFRSFNCKNQYCILPTLFPSLVRETRYY